MKVWINSITGIEDAISSMFFSKKTWTKELDEEIRRTVPRVIDLHGKMNPAVGATPEDIKKVNDWLDKLVKWGWTHTTMLRFIDISITTEGIHRAGQDDIDAHAKRFNNRIIRSSTRLATYGDGEMSDWYKDKIIPTDAALASLGIDKPAEITIDGVVYVTAPNGYVRKDLEQNKDARRGLYMLSIPSSFVSKIDLCEWAHVYKERGAHGHANPEVKEWAEMVADGIESFVPQFNRELFMKVKN